MLLGLEAAIRLIVYFNITV